MTRWRPSFQARNHVMSTHATPFKPSTMIEFEVTDVEEARQQAERPEAVIAI